MGIQAILDPILASLTSAGTAIGAGVGALGTDLAATGAALTGGGALDAAATGSVLGANGALDTAALGSTLTAQNALEGSMLANAAPELDAAAAAAGVAPAGGSFADLVSSFSGTGALSGASTLSSGTGSTATASNVGDVAGVPGGATTSSMPTAGAAGGVSGASSGALPGSVAPDASATGDVTAPATAPTTAPVTPTSTPPVAPPATPPASDFMSQMGANFTKSLSNPGTLIAGGGLLYNMLKGNQQPANYNQLESQAAQMQSQGNQLASYLSSGTLPPGIQSGLDTAQRAAEATIKSQYASRGQSGSSAEAQDLANLSQSVVSNGAQIATQLLSQGISEQNMAASIYENLMKTSITQDQDLSNSISAFASALGGFKAPAQQTTTG